MIRPTTPAHAAPAWRYPPTATAGTDRRLPPAHGAKARTARHVTRRRAGHVARAATAC